MWKIFSIDGLETNYEVNEIGEIRNKITGHILKQREQQGYLHVGLSINGHTRSFRVHRIVALTFIPNTENKPYVNHKNGHRDDNRVENLEWVTPSENTRHAVITGAMMPTREHSVVQYSLSGEKLKTYKSIQEACRMTNSSSAKISNTCMGKRTQHNGYQWRYFEDSTSELPPVEEYSTKSKPVAQIDPKTGLVIAIYPSIAEGARAIQGTASAISHVILGDKNTKTHKGYSWKLAEDIVQDQESCL